MVTEIEKRYHERQIIVAETKTTIIIALAMMASVFIYGGIAYFYKGKPLMASKPLENIWGIINIVVIMMMVFILAIRRTIYYSKRLIKENFTLTDVLRQWRRIDIALMALAETIPLVGLITAILGMPFEQTFHFFVAGALLMLILMPVGIKVRSKLAILRESFPEIE